MQAIMSVSLPLDIAERVMKLAASRDIKRNKILREGIALVLEKYNA